MLQFDAASIDQENNTALSRWENECDDTAYAGHTQSHQDNEPRFLTVNGVSYVAFDGLEKTSSQKFKLILENLSSLWKG